MLVRAHRLGIPIVSSMGAGNKLDPEAFHIVDIAKTHTCPMARNVRRLLKQAGITKGIPVVFSTEKPFVPAEAAPEEAHLRRQVPGSISFVPSAAGLLLAGYVVRSLLRLG